MLFKIRHKIILYEMKGWIIATVSFSGFPPVVLILSGPNEKLEYIYSMVYSYKDEKYYFFKQDKFNIK